LWSFSLREAAGVEKQGCGGDEDDGIGEQEAEALEVDEEGGGGSEGSPGGVGGGDFAVAGPGLGPALVEVGAVGLG